MRLSTKGIYALEAMLALALQEPGQRLSVRSISQQTGLSERYLEQIFARLKKSGVVGSMRGKQGGYFLTRPATETTVQDVLVAAEGLLVPVYCTVQKPGDEKPCQKIDECPTRPVWVGLEQRINDFLGALTLAELAKRYRTGNYQQQVDFSI